MDLTEIVSITGVGGLHKVVGRRPNGLIVETLDEGKKRFATSVTQKVSFLEDISMYTNEGDIRLKEVLAKLDKHVKDGHKLPGKDAGNDDVKSFFKAVLPDFDQERVYISDIRKLFTWYMILKDHLDFAALLEEKDETKSEAKAEAPAEGKEKEKETKKAKTTVKKETTAKAKTAAPKTTGAKGAKASTPRKTGGG